MRGSKSEAMWHAQYSLRQHVSAHCVWTPSFFMHAIHVETKFANFAIQFHSTLVSVRLCSQSLVLFCFFLSHVFLWIFRFVCVGLLPKSIADVQTRYKDNAYQSLPKDETVSHHFYSNVFGSNNSLQQVLGRVGREGRGTGRDLARQQTHLCVSMVKSLKRDVSHLAC